MGIWDFLKTCFSKKALAEDIIKVMEKSYWRARKERPGEDEHYYLATALFNRVRAKKTLFNKPFYWVDNLPPWFQLEDRKKQEKELEGSFILNETELYAVLNPPQSIRALALFIVYKEVPEAAHYHEVEYNMIMGPILKMKESGTFWDLYRKKNPNIAKQLDKLE